MIIDLLPRMQGRGVGTNSRTDINAFDMCAAILYVISIFGCLGGCGESELPPGLTKKAITIDQVPSEARGAAKKAIPSVVFNEAWQNLDGQGKLHSYEIRGRQASDGKIREVRVSLSGEILESE
jgi:hypothetical protein